MQLSPNDVQKKTIVFQVFDYDGKFNEDDGIGEAQVPLWRPVTDLSRETEKMVVLDTVTKDKNRKPVLRMRRPTEMRTSVASVSGRSSASSTIERQQSSSTVTEQRVTEHHWTSRRSRSSSSSSSSGSSSPTRRITSSGGLSLRELNDRLERYIQQVNLTPDTNVTHIYRETVRWVPALA